MVATVRRALGVSWLAVMLGISTLTVKKMHRRLARQHCISVTISPCLTHTGACHTHSVTHVYCGQIDMGIISSTVSAQTHAQMMFFHPSLCPLGLSVPQGGGAGVQREPSPCTIKGEGVPAASCSPAATLLKSLPSRSNALPTPPCLPLHATGATGKLTEPSMEQGGLKVIV